MPRFVDQPRKPRTFLERFAKTADRIRGNVHGRMGTHAYRVTLVLKTWPGGEPGRGKPRNMRYELGCGKDSTGRVVPPSVLDDEGVKLRYGNRAEGMIEEGELLISEISAALITELGLSQFGSLTDDESVIFEVQQDTRDGSTAPVRTMLLKASPTHDVQGCQWSLVLKPAQAENEAFGPPL